MYINEEVDVSTFECLPDHLFHSVYFRRILVARHLPLSIQIKTGQVSSIVAAYHTVRIQHRNYFEDEYVAQCLSLRCVA